MKRITTLLLLSGLGAALVGGLYFLFDLRFSGGDNYPPYSTLRADPLGASALYDSLRALHGLTVARNLRPLSELREGAGTTLFYLGLDAERFRNFSEEDSRQLEGFLLEGGRLVLTLAPVTEPPERHVLETRNTDTQTSQSAKPGRTSDDKTSATRLGIPRTVALGGQFDLELGYRALDKSGESQETYQPATVERKSGGAVPESLRWRSGLFARRLGPAWRVIYARGKDAVMAERPYGKGEIVLATDSFLASNEALRDERQSALLAWLAGASRRLVFDETHLDIQEKTGVMTLALKYRLHAVFAVLGALAALFIWKSMTPLVPAADSDGKGAGGQVGRDAWAGLVDLLQRNIGREKVLRVCLTEWARGRTGTPGAKALERRLEEELARMESQPPGERDLVRTYRTMAELASRRRRNANGNGNGTGKVQ